MNSLVKLLSDEYGDPVEKPVWHLIVMAGGAVVSLCSGEVWGSGEGAAQGVTKTVKRGGITCTDCIESIKEIKAVKL